jgi:hypothetical protein
METQTSSCFTCRVLGSATFLGVSFFLMHERSHVPLSARGHRGFLAAASAVSLLASVARWRSA